MIRAIFIIFVLLITAPYFGCSFDDYCGYNNDDCVPDASCIPNNETYHSCGICACMKGEQLTISATSDVLSDATVGLPYVNQTQITARGGIKPYHWSLIIDQHYLNLLSWLEINDGGDDGDTAMIDNKPDIFPSESSIVDLKFKIHVFDSSVKGKQDRVDNKGVEKEVTVKTNPKT